MIRKYKKTLTGIFFTVMMFCICSLPVYARTTITLRNYNKKSGDTNWWGIAVVVAIFIVGALFVLFIKKYSDPYRKEIKADHSELAAKEIARTDPDFKVSEFYDHAEKCFRSVADAYNSSDLSGLSKFETEKLFDGQKKELASMLDKGTSRKIEDIKVMKKSLMLYSLESDNESVTCSIECKLRDYTTDGSDKVLNGSKKAVSKYCLLTFVRDREQMRKQEQYKKKVVVLKECPKCGEYLSSEDAQVCEFCGADLPEDAALWRLDKIEFLKDENKSDT